MKALSSIKYLLICLSFLALGCGGGGGDDFAAAPSPEPEVVKPLGRVWTVAEILAEPRKGGGSSEARCGGEFGFARCVCAPNVPGIVRYRPAILECNGNAGAILSGRLVDVFSVVVRDTQNRDRWPAAGSGFGGCSFATANSEDPPKRCSAFKVQDRFPIAGGAAEVHCFGASGYSDIFKDVVRITAKITNDPFSSNDEIERYCLVSGAKPLN